MRASLSLVALLLAGAPAALAQAPAAAPATPLATPPAAATPSPRQIVNALTPSANGPTTTRGIRVVHGGQAAVPSVSLNVDFATGSADLTPQAKKVLGSLGQALKDPKLAGDRFRIEGHTDTVGSPAYNKTLSEQRAREVARYLEKTYGIPGSRLEAVGMGEKGLLVPTPDQTPEARNRRVLVVNKGA
jgi:outer membrane protein OmpA-like peptidoglycan-associated protein